MEVRSNGQKTPAISEARANSADGFIDAIENYIRGHDVSMNLPLADAKVTVSARNLANNQLSLNLQLNGDESDDVTDVEARGKKGNIFKKGGFTFCMPFLSKKVLVNSEISNQLFIGISRKEAPSPQTGHAHPGFDPAEGHHRHPNGHWYPEDQGLQRSGSGLLLLHSLGWFGHFPIVQKGKQATILKRISNCLPGIRWLW